MPTVAIASCEDSNGMEPPEFFERERAGIAESLAPLGVECELVPWTREKDWSQYDMVAVRSTWDYTDRVDEFVRWARDVSSLTRLENPARVLEWNSHKGYLAGLGELGIDVLPTIMFAAESGHDVAQVCGEKGWDEIVLKPAVSAGARNTIRTRDMAEAQAHLRAMKGRDMMLQPFVHSVPVDGERSLLYVDGSLSHAVQKVPKTNDYRTQGIFGATETKTNAGEHEQQVSQQVFDHVRERFSLDRPLLYARMDFVNHNGRPHLIEAELIEPWMYMDQHPAVNELLAKAIAARV